MASNSESIKKSFKFILYFVGLMWAVWLIDLVLPYEFARLGIRPRSFSGLIGIVFAPIIHANFLHLLSNTFPIIVLLLALFIYDEKKAVTTILLSVLLGGILVWTFAREAFHVGASGLIYSLAAYLIASAFFRFDFKSFIIALIIFIFYGGLIWGIFPTRSWVSFEGHLFGAIAGIFIAWLINKKLSK
ncbi:MAG: rhomboid family intramembrane serine protease [Bacteroidota bacterium]|nr:rhomboid family intramembrane serine protease [Bacteroidota bacterium]